MGLFGSSQKQEKKNQKRNLDWYYTDEAIKRFNSFIPSKDVFWHCFEEHGKLEDFVGNMRALSNGQTSLLTKLLREFEENLCGDNALRFIVEYIDTYLDCQCGGSSVELLTKFGCLDSERTYWRSLVFVCYEMMSADEEKRDDWSYPRGLKENNLLLLWLTLFEASKEYGADLFNYSRNTNNALLDLIDMITFDYINEDFRKIEPVIFDKSFYKDVRFESEFVGRINSVIQKYKKQKEN